MLNFAAVFAIYMLFFPALNKTKSAEFIKTEPLHFFI